MVSLFLDQAMLGFLTTLRRVMEQVTLKEINSTTRRFSLLLMCVCAYVEGINRAWHVTHAIISK